MIIRPSPSSCRRVCHGSKCPLNWPASRHLEASLGIVRGRDIGSNDWTISGSRTTTGKPLLANDPHLGIQMPSIWYFNSLHCQPVTAECPFDVTGAVFPGAPGVIIGHNAKIAWGVTNVGPDVQDLFLEKIAGKQYEYKGQQLDLKIVPETWTIKGKVPAGYITLGERNRYLRCGDQYHQDHAERALHRSMAR